MRKHWWLIVAGVLLIVALAGVGGHVLGGIQTVKGISVTRTTPHQLAEAMKQDRFFADYRHSALLVSGTIASVDRGGGHLIVAFKTGSTMVRRAISAHCPPAFCYTTASSPENGLPAADVHLPVAAPLMTAIRWPTPDPQSARRLCLHRCSGGISQSPTMARC